MHQKFLWCPRSLSCYCCQRKSLLSGFRVASRQLPGAELRLQGPGLPAQRWVQPQLLSISHLSVLPLFTSSLWAAAASSSRHTCGDP